MFRAARRLGDARKRVALQKRLMAIDWSWTQPAAEYLALYDRLTQG